MPVAYRITAKYYQHLLGNASENRHFVTVSGWGLRNVRGGAA